MADSVDRVFVHALNTVKKIPRTGSARPPPSDRLRLYGLYKQAMEGDVDGVMERPGKGSRFNDSEELRKEREKWDAWNAQKGLSKTEAKKRYIEALIQTMHKYASTTEAARQLVEELEFVWDQIKNNSTASSASSPQRASRQIQAPLAGTDGPMRVLSPMSQNDEAELESKHQVDEGESEDDFQDALTGDPKPSKKWRSKVEQALGKMTAELAALREQITTGREYQGRRKRSPAAWIGWLIWVCLKHVTMDAVILALVLLYMRKKKDRRLEDLVRATLRLVREYVRNILPPR